MASTDNGPSEATSEFVDTAEGIAAMVDVLALAPTTAPRLPEGGEVSDPRPWLFMDSEGVNLSRNGSLSILQIHVAPRKHTYLVDVHALQGTAFNTAGGSGSTLKDILEREDIQKVFFDVQNDSDAMYHHYEVKLAGIVDLQLMEFALQDIPRNWFHGLVRCMENVDMSDEEWRAFQRCKRQGKELFSPEEGGSYEVFNARPLSDAIRQYCVQDVQYLPRLYDRYLLRDMGPVLQASQGRVIRSQESKYRPHCAAAMGLWTWDYFPWHGAPYLVCNGRVCNGRLC